ncbi:tetratricopeptide repeat protein [Haloferula sp. BvORR071]|uniref:tetratricopeptide repeat protein n=1 Tax=Haloferula sp. BvORR071 TaxID=1396141 RepID=UPI000554D021|nr:tetratricopeptide repeat protein [Haloferula sp. BvORR071]
MKPAVLLILAVPALAKADPKLDFALGILAGQRGDRLAANAAIEKAQAADPTAFPLMTRVAQMRQAAGDVAAASTFYRDFAKAAPERLDAQIAYADFLRDVSPNDDFAGKIAAETLEKAALRFPRSLAIEKRLFRIYESMEQREKSRAIFEELAQPGLGDAATLAAVDMARTLFPKDNAAGRARMDELLKQAVQASPDNPVLARTASEHFRNTGRLPEAMEMLAKHVAADPSSLELHTRLGILQLAAERQADGEKTLKEVLAIDPRQALAHQSLAKLYRNQGRIPEALPHAAETLKIRGGSPSEFLTLADEFLAADQPREARLLLEKAVFFNQSDPDLAVKLAVATRRDPETHSSASRLFREAETLAGTGGAAKDPVFLSEFAESLLEGGQVPAAEERLRAAIRSYKADQKKEQAAAMRRLAGIWEQGKKNADAARSLRQRADALDSPQ